MKNKGKITLGFVLSVLIISILILGVILIVFNIKIRNKTEIEFITAKSAFDGGDYDGSLEKALSFIKKHPASQRIDEAYDLSIRSLLGLHRYQNAEKLINERLEKSDKKIHNGLNLLLAQIKLSQDKFSEAGQIYDSILKTAKDDKLKGKALLGRAKLHEKEDEFLEAKKLYKEIITKHMGLKIRKEAKKCLGSLRVKLMFTPFEIEDFGDSKVYTVKPGDRLSTISGKFNTTVELIKKSNNIKGFIIRPNDMLKIVSGIFSVEISKSKNVLILKFKNKPLKSYLVGTGKTKYLTPSGTFKITSKLVDPPWKGIAYGDSRNILGTRWMGFDKRPDIGIHGTTQPETIGKHSSAGCIRMFNRDAEELFALLPLGTDVVIKE
jgi:LysM repeat protein